MLDFIHLSATGVAKIAKSTNLKGCPHMFVYIVYLVVSLKHVGITDWDKDRLKMSVKTLARWSVCALRTLPGIPSGLENVNLFRKVVFTSAMESEITQPSRTTGTRKTQCCIPRSEHKRHSQLGLPLQSIRVLEALVCKRNVGRSEVKGFKSPRVKVFSHQKHCLWVSGFLFLLRPHTVS